MTGQMAELAKITDALYQVELAKMQRVAAEEQKIRQLLEALDRQNVRAGAGSPEEMQALRALGADILWQNWVGGRRATLQMQLANILVRKARAVDGLRRAFGKADVAARMQALDMARRQRDRARQRDQKDQDAMLF